MKNTLITGISGYLGSRLAKELVRQKDIGKVVGIDIVPPDAELAKKIIFYQKDIRDETVREILIRHQITAVLHLAFVVKPIHDLKKMHAIDAGGTTNILEQSFSAGVRQFITTSSTLAYGAHPDNPPLLTEDHPLRGNKTFPYGFYKAETDRMIQAFASEHPAMTVTILRPCTVFGPNVNNYVSRMLFLPVTVNIRGANPPVQFVHEDDFVSACLSAIEKNRAGAFNIAADGTLTVREIAAMQGTKTMSLPPWLIYPVLEALWRIRFPIIEVNRGYLDYIRYPFVASNQKAKQELDFYPRYSSVETLGETIRNR